MLKIFFLALALSCMLLCQGVWAQEAPAGDGPAHEQRNCRDLSGDEKKACIREVKKAHAARYSEKKMDRKSDEPQNGR